VRHEVRLVAIERPDGLLVERLLDAGLRIFESRVIRGRGKLVGPPHRGAPSRGRMDTLVLALELFDGGEGQYLGHGSRQLVASPGQTLVGAARTWPTARAKSAAEGKRSAGRLAIARATTRSKAFGRWGRVSVTFGGSAFR
jgi:hypothetical protein